MTEFWDRRAKQFLVISGVLLIIFVIARFAQYFSEILLIIGTSILIAYLLIGPVDLLTKIVKFRWLSVMLVYLFIASFLIWVMTFLGPKVKNEFIELSKQIPEMLVFIEQSIHKFQQFLIHNNIPITLSISTDLLPKALENLTIHEWRKFLGAAIGTVHTLFYTLITAVISYYFLLDGHNIAKGITHYIPKKYEKDIHNLIGLLDKCLRRFYGGMVILAAINASVMFTTYLIMKVPYAFLLALWHFVSCIIPTVGGWIGIIPACIVIAFTDPFKIWVPLVVYEGFTRLIKDNFITPHIMGNAIGMHPVVVLIAILVGLKTAGIVGIVFALPIFGAVNVILKYFLGKVRS